MGNHQLASLIKMVNQIAANNTHIGDDVEAAEMVANHLDKFWARSMKQQIIAYRDTDGSELLPIASQAIALMSR